MVHEQRTVLRIVTTNGSPGVRRRVLTAWQLDLYAWVRIGVTMKMTRTSITSMYGDVDLGFPRLGR
jgi:hypothetical protein